MAATLTEFPKIVRKGRDPKYPLNEWFDGQIWQLKSDEDFTAKVESIQSYLSGAARERGLILKTTIVEDGIVIQVVGKREQKATTKGRAKKS